MKKNLCLLLALCLLAGLTAGCGQSAGNPSSAASSSAASAVSESEPAESGSSAVAAEAESAVSEPEKTEVSEETSSIASVESAAESDDGRPFPAPANPLSYPIADGDKSFSFCYEHMPVLNSVGIDDYSENPTWQYAQEMTGVNLTWVPLAPGSSGDTMSLWIASGDMPDITGVFSYSDGQDAAVEQDLIITLDGQEEHYPDFLAMLESDETFHEQSLSESGLLHCFTLMTDQPRRKDAGMMIRRDWLDELGMTTPETIDELTDVLHAFKEHYNAGIGLYSGMATDTYSLCNAYGIAAFNMFQKYWYQVDGEVRMGMIQPEYRDYLTLLHGWYEDGLINEELMMQMGMAMNGEVDQINGSQVGVWYGWVDSIPAWTANIGGNAHITAMADPVLNKGDTLKLGGNTGSVKGDESFYITTSCTDPETAMEFMNWFYTEDGILAANYGVEGVTFEYNADGEPEFTDLIINNDLGLGAINATQAYAIYSIGTYQYVKRYDVMYSDEELQAFEIIEEHKTAEYDYSDKIPMTSDETMSYYTIMSDIDTYLATAVLSFVTGERSLDEFDQYVEEIRAMNIDEAVAIKQAAYDRYTGA